VKGMRKQLLSGTLRLKQTDCRHSLRSEAVINVGADRRAVDAGKAAFV
jgi:hypothetical protein